MGITRDTADIRGDVTTELAAKADLASPTFTGTPAAPTAANGTNTTQIATTAFVLANAPASGLTLITGQSFSEASSVIINNCFTSTYDNYRVMLNVSGSSATDVFMRLRVSGSDNTTSNYNTQTLTSTNTTVQGSSEASRDKFYLAYQRTSVPCSMAADIYRPQASDYTRFFAEGDINSYIYIRSGYFNSTTQFDGMTLFPASGTMTGTVRIYGYKNS